ncbi:MAG: MarR family transcriptional regulator [Candidatus Cloacimonadales bacterium]
MERQKNSAAADLPAKGSALSTLLFLLMRKKVKHFNQLLEPASIDVSARQFYLLRHIFRNDGCTQREISAKLCRDKTLITRMIGTLARKDILQRRPDAQDKRVKRIFLTAKGRELRDELMSIYCQHERAIVQNITESEIEQFLQISKRIIANCVSAEEYANLEERLFSQISSNLSEFGCKEGQQHEDI